MIRANVDIIAVSILIAAGVLCSSAHKVVVWDVFSNRKVVVERPFAGPNVEVISLLPVLSCLKD
jgi:hypothetical protein